jgi:hypothetical protein
MVQLTEPLADGVNVPRTAEAVNTKELSSKQNRYYYLELINTLAWLSRPLLIWVKEATALVSHQSYSSH